MGPRRQDGPDDTEGQADRSEVPADAVEGPVLGLARRDLEFASGGEFACFSIVAGCGSKRWDGSSLIEFSAHPRCGAQTIDWAGGMIDWKDPTYVAQGNAFKAHVQWVDIQCYSGSDLNLPFVQGNSSSSSNSTSRLRERELWPRAQAINSYIYGSESLSAGASLLSVVFVGAYPAFIGEVELTNMTFAANNSAGQIGVSGSNAGTIINSAYSTGQNSESATATTKYTTHVVAAKSAHRVVGRVQHG